LRSLSGFDVEERAEQTDEPESEKTGKPGSEELSGSENPRQPRVPPTDPGAHEQGKRFMVAGEALQVTATGGSVTSSYAPGDLISKLTAHVHALLRDVGGGVPPMLYAVLPSNSMTLYFGDARSNEAQSQIPVELTLSHAKRVAGLIELDDNELFAKARELGAPAHKYSELAHFVENEELTLEWKPHGEKARILTPQRAAIQYALLTAEPSTKDHRMTIHGTLYRIIAEPQRGRLGTLAMGTLGIRLFNWSAKPRSRHRQGQKVLALYLNDAVESSVREGLIGNPVEATLIIRQPDPGTAIDPEVVELIVDTIKAGPSEKSRLGTKIFDDSIDDEVIDG
jgi:hypothetical protein